MKRSDQRLKSLASLAQLVPDLAAQVQTVLEVYHDTAPPIVVEESRRGTPTVILEGRWIHSRFDPEQEARRTAAEATHKPVDAIVVFGIGLGYVLEEIRRIDSDMPLVVVVPFRSCIEWCLEHRTAHWWAQLQPISILPTTEIRRLTTILQAVHANEVELIGPAPIRQTFEAEYREVASLLNSYRTRRTVNTNTIKRFGRLWVRNSLRNRSIVAGRPGLAQLIGLFADVPAVVCAAGPSLDDSIELVGTLRDRALIIGVDTALHGLNRNGIAPDIAVVVDPQYWNSRHLDSVRLPDTILVTEPATYPRVPRMWKDSVLVGGSLFPLGQALNPDNSVRLGAGGSVATSAWDLARLVGSRTIYVAGLDLAFPHRRTHYRDAFFQRLALKRNTRFSTAESAAFRYMFDAGVELITDADGGTVLSDPRMAVYRQWFSEQAKLYPEVNTYHLSTLSASIDGVGVAPIDRIEALPVMRPTIDERLAAVRSTNGPTSDSTHVTQALHHQLSEIKEIATEALEVITRTEELPHIGPDSLSDLQEIDQQLANHPGRNVVGFLLTAAFETLTRDKAATLRESVHQSRQLYSAILESIQYHQHLLDRYSST